MATRKTPPQKQRSAPHSGTVTMADVAQRVGVSKMTVSRALKAPTSPNNTGQRDTSTSAALRQRILKACDEMGYVVDQTARTFSSKRSGFVAALIPSINNSNFSETVQGLSDALEGSGLQLLLGITDYRVENEERLIKTLLARRPEAVVLTGGNHTPLARHTLLSAGIPVIETWDLPAQPIEHTVGFSNAKTMEAMVQHLHEQGYRRIAFIGGTSNRDTRGADRKRGYTEAVRKLGLPAGLVISFGQPPISMEQGGQAMEQLMRQWPDVDAVMCASDLSAFGALMQCQRRGWAVPERVAIAGFGNFEVSRACCPTITTVAVDCMAIGTAAGELLLRAIEAARLSQRLPRETVMIPFRIERRQSS